MLWNIWLSVVPLGVLLTGWLSATLLLLVARPGAYVVLIVTGVVWLLLPNSSYLITELNQSHRRENDVVPLWYDIILVITLALERLRAG